MKIEPTNDARENEMSDFTKSDVVHLTASIDYIAHHLSILENHLNCAQIAIENLQESYRTNEPTQESN